MKRHTVMKLALSTALIGISTTGCANFSSKQAGISKSANAGEKKAAKWAASAEKYLASGKVSKSVIDAERAVEADFRNSAYRSTLARAYIAQGRFASAERTLQDVLDLGQSDPRTVISLALLRTSQGRTQSAISLLNSYRDILPAGDYGLALAVAGDTEQAVSNLVETVRSSNTAQVRQNLAMAYALNGQWREARVMASQDLTGTQLNQNIAQWAQFARPDAYQQRVAAMLGVQPKQDIGQPARLALNSRSNPNIDLAAIVGSDKELEAIGPAPTPSFETILSAKEDNVKVASSAIEPTAIPASSPKAVSTPVIKSAAGPVKVAAPKPEPRPKPSAKPAAKKPAKLALAKTAQRKTATRTIASQGYTVQLGAFSSTQNATKAWSKITAEHNILKPFQYSNTVMNSKGRKLYRLSAVGFGNKQTAVSMCERIKDRGGSCIVRKNTNGSPTRLASVKPKKIASSK